jgi:hypothetical protein
MDMYEFIHIQMVKKYHEELKKRIKESEKGNKSKAETKDNNLRLGRNGIQTPR